jgi:transcriptional regulator with XRE-family HTH domain
MRDAYAYLQEIELLAKQNGLHMAELCRKAGMQQSLVSRWRSRAYEPRLSSLRKLEDALTALIAERDTGTKPSSIEDLL